MGKEGREEGGRVRDGRSRRRSNRREMVFVMMGFFPNEMMSVRTSACG